MVNLESEVKRLDEMRYRQAAVAESIGKSREKIVGFIREIREARIQCAMDPEAHSEKETEVLCRKLEGQRATLQNDIDKRVADLEVLTSAIQRMESEIIPQRHAARLERQQEVREQYREICARILDAANMLATLNDDAMKAFQSAEREFRSDELCVGHDVVLRHAGLRAIHDTAWISFPGQPSRRDFWINRVYDYAKDLVPESDPVVASRRHQEAHYQSECARHEAEQRRRIEKGNEQLVEYRKTTLKERQSGEWVSDDVISVRHPLSPLGLAEDLGLIRRRA